MRGPGKAWLLPLAAFLCLASGAWAAPAPEPGAITAKQLARRVDSYYNHLHSLRTDFTETYQGMGMNRSESGTLLLRKPGKMRWSYSKPAGKLFLLDGKYGWFYSPGSAQVERVSAAQLDDLRSPLRFLLGHTKLEKELENLALTQDAAGYELSGVPKGMEQRVANIALQVTGDGIIHAMTIEETSGARTSFTFTNAVPNAPASDADFVFHAPPGIPVVRGLPPV